MPDGYVCYGMHVRFTLSLRQVATSEIPMSTRPDSYPERPEVVSRPPAPLEAENSVTAPAGEIPEGETPPSSPCSSELSADAAHPADRAEQLEQLSLAALYRLGAVEDILTGRGGIEAEILDAVLITAAVINFLGMDTNGLAVFLQAGNRAGYDAFRHNGTS